MGKRERKRCRRAGEARDAARKRRREEEQALRRQGDRLLRQRKPQDEEDIFALFDVNERKPSRFRDLLQTIKTQRPELLNGQHHDLIRHLRHVPWNRRASEWRPRHRSEIPALKELLRHLFALYPMPAFLIRAAIEDPYKRHHTLGALQALGRGRALRELPPACWVHWRLTRRMQHLFLRSPAHADLPFAAMRAVLRGLGGDDALARNLIDGMIYNLDEVEHTDFIYSACRWFIRHGPFTDQEMDALDSEIAESYRRDPTWSPTGRSPRVLLAAVARREREKRRIDRSIPAVFPASGLRAGLWIRPAWGRPQGERWTMTEILTRKGLIAEGVAMRHCIAEYAEDASGPDTSIWSLRRDDRRKLTVQVTRDVLAKEPHAFRLHHAAGRANRNATAEEYEVLDRWAEENGMPGYWD